MKITDEEIYSIHSSQIIKDIFNPGSYVEVMLLQEVLLLHPVHGEYPRETVGGALSLLILNLLLDFSNLHLEFLLEGYIGTG